MASFKENEKHDFNLEVVLASFIKCRQTDHTIVLEDYLQAFHELCRFFKLAGPIFSFVAQDIESKIKAIQHHAHSPHSECYKSIQSMAEFEIREGITHKKTSPSSGCRNLLRLHWALEFILSFMRRLQEGGENESSSTIAWEVYSATLCKHHPWWTQKLAYFAVFMLPSKKKLIDVMCKQDYESVLALLGKVVDAGQPVYDIVESVFANNKLLNIP